MKAGNYIGINRIPMKFIGLMRIYAQIIAETAPDVLSPR